MLSTLSRLEGPRPQHERLRGTMPWFTIAILFSEQRGCADTLMARPNSLLRREPSLLCENNSPVPNLREFREKASIAAVVFDGRIRGSALKSKHSPVFSLYIREFGGREGFALDCVIHTLVSGRAESSENRLKTPRLRGFLPTTGSREGLELRFWLRILQIYPAPIWVAPPDGPSAISGGWRLATIASKVSRARNARGIRSPTYLATM
jgi:hypothetical protein